MPNKKNPFGDGEVTTKFADFDIIKKVRPRDRVREERDFSNRACLISTLNAAASPMANDTAHHDEA